MRLLTATTATAGHVPGWLVATLTVIVAVGVYVLSCWWWPFARCWCCDGKAHHSPKDNSRISRPCRWCRGTGKRLRLGRRVWNRFAKIRKAAN